MARQIRGDARLNRLVNRFYNRLEALEPRQLLAASLLDPLSQVPYQFTNPLPIPGVIQPTSGNHYEVSIGQFTQDLGLRAADGSPLGPATVWGYNGSYPGPTFVVNSGEPISVTWSNDLVDGTGAPLPHLFPIDVSIPTAPSSTGVPVVTHLHGGHTESASDGLPGQWYTPGVQEVGPDFVSNTTYYGNDQEASTIWYHDHAMGYTRQNVYAGLAGFYLIRDPYEAALNLPSGAYEVGLAIQDRLFTEDGQLYYPTDPLDEGHPAPSVHPEMFGDTILVNGKAWPVLEVEPRLYRFRMLNGSDSRFYHMTLSSGQPFYQIGTDQGLLDRTLRLKEVLLGPGERQDILLDFSDPKLWGKTIILNNDGATPFPNGDPIDPLTTGRIMAFRVNQPLQDAAASKVKIPVQLRKENPIEALPESTKTRQLLLFESEDEYGRILPLVGTVAEGGMMFHDAVTENPMLNATETWEFYNTTPDAHPIHLHLVKFEVLSRQAFTAVQDPVTGALSDINLGRKYKVSGSDQGWKDTVIVYPGEVVRIRARFDMEGLYVWHCHILSHEEHDMMRPYYVGAMEEGHEEHGMAGVGETVLTAVPAAGEAGGTRVAASAMLAEVAVPGPARGQAREAVRSASRQVAGPRGEVEWWEPVLRSQLE